MMKAKAVVDKVTVKAGLIYAGFSGKSIEKIIRCILQVRQVVPRNVLCLEKDKTKMRQ